jgi:hypothetical protein
MDFDIFIKGEKIKLVVLNEDIVNNTNWHKWFNDEETTYHMQKHYFPNTLEAQIMFYKSNQKNDMVVQLGIVCRNDNVFCGIVSLNNINFFNRNAEISLIIGEKKYRTLDIAHESMGLIINHAFSTLNLYKVSVGYVDTLESWGVFLQNSFGFIQEGIQREHAFKNGEYLNIINLGLTINDYRKKVKNINAK